MIITNVNGQFIKIESDYVSSLFDADPPYISVEVKANVNCCGNINGQQIASTNFNPSDASWNIDLDTPVKLATKVLKIRYKNVITGIVYDDLLSPLIDLDHVEDNCVSNGCTMQDFDDYFAPLFKTAIDNFFNDLGVNTDVTIEFDENTIKVFDIPSPFILQAILTGESTDFVSISYGSYGGPDTDVFLADNALWITPKLFNADRLQDGVYSIELKFNESTSGYVAESNCAFIDIETKCKVAGTLQNIIPDSKDANSESTSTLIHMLHYALVNGSNCGCNCDEMCKVYTELYRLLSENSDIVNIDCGC